MQALKSLKFKVWVDFKMVPGDIRLELEIAHRLTLGEWECLLFNGSWRWDSQISDEKNIRATSVKVEHSDVNSLI